MGAYLLPWAAVTSLNNFLGPVGDCGSAKYLLLSPKSYLKEGTYHTRLFRGPSTNGMKK